MRTSRPGVREKAPPAAAAARAQARQARELGSSWDLVRPRLGPYLVRRHQIEVAGVCGVKLHDVVHRLPVGHRHHLPAHHLHALVQVDLGWGGSRQGTVSHEGARQGEAECGGPALGVGADPGWESPPLPLSRALPGLAEGHSTLLPLLCPHQGLPRCPSWAHPTL